MKEEERGMLLLFMTLSRSEPEACGHPYTF